MERKIETDINRILSQAEQYDEEAVRMLGKLCSIDSGTGDLQGNREIGNLIDSFFEEMGVKTEHICNDFGDNLLVRIQEGRSKDNILLSAHTDTVFSRGDASKHPFHIEGDFAYGLGSSDCKGGIVVILYALKILNDCKMLPEKEIMILLNCDEEKGSPCSRIQFRELCRNTSMAFVFEPAREENGVLTARMGSGRALIEVTGKQAHAARFWEGVSATEGLAMTIVKMMEFNRPEEYLYFNVGPIEVPTADNVVAPYASARVTFRVNGQHPFEESLKKLKSLEQMAGLKDCQVRVTAEQSFPSMDRSDANVKLYQHVKRAAALIGMELPEQSTTGSGDANFFSSMGIPTICGMGSYTYGPHVVSEKTSLTSLKERIRLAAAMLASL